MEKEEFRGTTLEASNVAIAPDIVRPNSKLIKFDVTHDFSTVMLVNEEGLVEVVKIWAPFGEVTETWKKPKGAYIFYHDKLLVTRKEGLVSRKPLPYKGKDEKFMDYQPNENGNPLLFKQTLVGAFLVFPGTVYYIDHKQRTSYFRDKKIFDKLTYRAWKDSRLMLCKESSFLVLDMAQKDKEKVLVHATLDKNIEYGFIEENCITVCTATHCHIYYKENKKDKYTERVIPLTHGSIVHSAFFFTTTRITFNAENRTMNAFDHLSGDKLLEFIMPDKSKTIDPNTFFMLVWQHFLVVCYSDGLYFWNFDNREATITSFLKIPLGDECISVLYEITEAQLRVFVLTKNSVYLLGFDFKKILAIINKIDTKKRDAHILPSSTKKEKFKLADVFNSKKGSKSLSTPSLPSNRSDKVHLSASNPEVTVKSKKDKKEKSSYGGGGGSSLSIGADKRDLFERMKSQNSFSSDDLRNIRNLGSSEGSDNSFIYMEKATEIKDSIYNAKVSFGDLRCERDLVTSKVTALIREKNWTVDVLEERKIGLPLYFANRFMESNEATSCNFWIGFITKLSQDENKLFSEHLSADNSHESIFCVCSRVIDNLSLFLFISPQGNQHLWEVKNLKPQELEKQLIDDLEKHFKFQNNTFLLQRVNASDNVTLSKELVWIEEIKKASILNAFKCVGIIYRKKGQFSLPEILANRDSYDNLKDFLKHCKVQERQNNDEEDEECTEGALADNDTSMASMTQDNYDNNNNNKNADQVLRHSSKSSKSRGEKSERGVGDKGEKGLGALSDSRTENRTEGGGRKKFKKRQDKPNSNTYYYSTWQEFECQWHIAPILDEDEQRQKIGNSMCLIVYDETDDVIDPSTFNFGKVSNTILFVRKIKSQYRVTLTMNITLSSTIPNFGPTESAQLKEAIGKNWQNFNVKKDTVAVGSCRSDDLKYLVHSSLFNGILLAFQHHPQLIKVYEKVVSPKFSEIAALFAPKILKTLNSK